MAKTTREVLSCRIPQELKHKLETNARSEGTSTSNYVEQLILNHQNGEHITEDREEEYLQRIEQLERRLAEAEQTRVQYENRLVESEHEILNLSEERDEFEQAWEGNTEALNELQKQVAALEVVSSEKDERLAEFKSKKVFNFLSAERANLSEYVLKLQEYYPDATEEQIILGSLYSTVQNERPLVFVVSEIKDYFKTL